MVWAQLGPCALHQVLEIPQQLHASRSVGMVPAAFLGGQPFVPSPCAPTPRGRRAGGDNRWDRYFWPVSAYRLGAATIGARPVRVFVASARDTGTLPREARGPMRSTPS